MDKLSKQTIKNILKQDLQPRHFITELPKGKEPVNQSEVFLFHNYM